MLCIIFSSCRTHEEKKNALATGNEYSDKFSITNFHNYSILPVRNPWQNAEGTGFSYVLEKGSAHLPDSLSAFPVIHVPVKNVVVFSTTHVGFIAALHEENTISGISGSRYIYNKNIRNRIDSGKVSDVGYAPAVDYETIIGLNPDLVVLYGLNSSVTGISDRLGKAGIPSVIIAEYLEAHPLGKMEWIKVFGAFYQKEQLAGELFSQAEQQYIELCNQAKSATTKPKVMVGLPWKDTWFMAGGKSFTARLITDAGGDYLWSDNPSVEYIPLDLETVFMKAYNADYWINAGSSRTLSEIQARDERFSILPVFKRGMIYNNDARLNEAGGNDFWESGVVNPDKVLADLVKIFHPDLIGEHTFVYYRKLE